MIKQAIMVAGEAHKDDDWSGLPYLVHLALTAEEIRTLLPSEVAIATAWLHDVLEDHPVYRERIEREFPQLVSSLLVVCRRDEEEYDAFIDRIIESGDSVAIAVKVADMRVNLAGDPPIRLWQRYSRNIGRLEAALR